MQKTISLQPNLSPPLILTVLLGYFALLIAISWATGRGAGNESFFIGERKSKWYLVAFGMIGASLSGVTFISIPGVVGNLNSPNGAFSYMQLALGYLLGYFVIATTLMPLYYRLRLTSIYTYLEQRFGFWSYKTGAFYFLLSRTIGSCFRLFLVAIVLQRFVFDYWHIPFPVTVMITLLLIWIYTFKGGIKTIVYTDTLQTLFMLLSVGITIYIIGAELHLNFRGLIAAIRESPYAQMFFWNPREDNYFFKQFFSGAFIAIVMTGLDQDMMQKNNSCRNIGEAQKNMFVFSLVLLVVNLIFVSLGALLYIYAEERQIPIPQKTDYLFPTLALQHFPAVAGIVFIIGLIAAAYSSADSALTALTTSFCVDFLGFEKKATLSDRLMKTRYLVHVGFTVLSLLVVLLFNYVLDEDVVSNVFRAAGYTYGPLLGLYAFGLFTKRIVRDHWVPLVCLISPVLCYLLNMHSADLLEGYEFGFELLIVNGLLTFTGLWIISKKQ
ncbi:MAG: sodium:solute symporter [Chitinophagales bacterium]|nr:MAG: sodium:solute symporter [Chitinophagales bacterium]